MWVFNRVTSAPQFQHNALGPELHDDGVEQPRRHVDDVLPAFRAFVGYGVAPPLWLEPVDEFGYPSGIALLARLLHLKPELPAGWLLPALGLFGRGMCADF